MTKGKLLTKDEEIRDVLKDSRTVAVLGLSTNPDKTSYKIAEFLKNHDYDITPVRPGASEILGKKVVEDLSELDNSPDILNVFRKSEDVIDHVEDAVKVKPKVFWMQLGIKNQEAAERLMKNGINVIMDRCIKVEYRRLCG